jgi:adenine-specific DNA-methyltransferase
MARIEDLIGQIADSALRRKLEEALSDLRRREPFGLVFEEHVAEMSTLVGLPVTAGATVVRRSDPAGKLYRVQAVNRRATIEPEDGGLAETEAAKELLVVKRSGDPIFPALTSLGTLRRGPADRPHHAVINGENFHALQLLVYLYEGRIDCIYIDPPYNTGARDWKYNNRYVDSKDAWRHSKWLSFMEKRLALARRLLKPDGVLVATIDEHEIHHLGMLLEKLFPNHLRHTVTIVINPKGTGKLNFARMDEYAIFCVPDVGYSVIAGEPTSRVASQHGDGEAAEASNFPFPEKEIGEWELRHARRRGSESSYREQRKNQFYPIYVDPKARRVVRAGEALPLGQEPTFESMDGLAPVWPIDKEGHHRCWRFIPASMQALIDAGRVVLGKHHKAQDTWTLNYWVRKSASKKLETVWWDTSHDAGTHGTTLLSRILGRRNAFPFPKSVYAVRDCLAAVVRHRPDALILDFFAGSGTTLHATCLLNAEDGGRRRCLLVTNNEVAEKDARRLARQGVHRGDLEFERHGIFEQATRPRCEAVVKGERPDGQPIPGAYLDGRPMSQGFEENIEFFRIDYLDADDVDPRQQFEAILPLLWLAAGGVGCREGFSTTKGYSIPGCGRYAVLFREEAFRKLERELKGRPDVTHVWIVTDSEEAFAEMRSALPCRLVTSMLSRDYLKNFRINIRPNI